MNKSIVFFFVAFVTLIGLHNYADAQDITLDEDFLIEIPTDKPLEANYTLDVSALSFDSDEQRDQFLNLGVANLYQVTMPDPTQPDIWNIELRLIYQSSWTQADWNTYLESLAAQWASYYSQIKNE